MRTFAFGLAIAFLFTLSASGEPEHQCGLGEHVDDLSRAIRPGAAVVHLLPVGPIQRQIFIYQLGYPELKQQFDGGDPGSVGRPLRFELHGPGIFCTVGDGILGFRIYSVE
jgi:hypothetical protein